MPPPPNLHLAGTIFFLAGVCDVLTISCRYSSGGHRDVPMNGTSASPVRSPTSSRAAGSYIYERSHSSSYGVKLTRIVSALIQQQTSTRRLPTSTRGCPPPGPPTQTTYLHPRSFHEIPSNFFKYPEDNTTGGGSGNSYPSTEPERRRYPSSPTTTAAAAIASSSSTTADPHHYHRHHLHHHHHHHPQPSRYDQDPLRSPARDYEGRTRRHSNGGSPPRMSPPTKHAPIPAPTTDDQVRHPPRAKIFHADGGVCAVCGTSKRSHVDFFTVDDGDTG
jgi:hypothetical protein